MLVILDSPSMTKEELGEWDLQMRILAIQSGNGSKAFWTPANCSESRYPLMVKTWNSVEPRKAVAG